MPTVNTALQVSVQHQPSVPTEQIKKNPNNKQKPTNTTTKNPNKTLPRNPCFLCCSLLLHAWQFQVVATPLAAPCLARPFSHHLRRSFQACQPSIGCRLSRAHRALWLKLGSPKPLRSSQTSHGQSNLSRKRAPKDKTVPKCYNSLHTSVP